MAFRHREISQCRLGEWEIRVWVIDVVAMAKRKSSKASKKAIATE
jgi:hypothetical protein